MNESEGLLEVRRWLRYAQEDLEAAEALVGQPYAAARHSCWLAQQAAEKALKAILVFLQVDFPRSHDLDVLRHLIPGDWQVAVEHPDLADLTEWAVEARYPGDWPEATAADARDAVQRARAVWTSVTADLTREGLEPEGRP
jgi:HEPN domain-containing protein